MMKKYFLAFPLFLLAGCAAGPNYHAPQTSLLGGFYSQPSAKADEDKIENWWKSFKDPQLDELVARALKNNLDLKIALARLQESREMEAATAGGAMPSMEGSAGAGRGSGTNSAKGRVSQPLNAATNTTGLSQIKQVAGFDAGWEIDLFGKYRREIEAVSAQSQVASEIRNGVLIALIADVAHAYMDSVAYQRRLKIAEDNISVQQQTVELVSERYKIGISNELDYEQAIRELATLESTVEPLKTGAREANRRLAVLLGEYPEDLKIIPSNHFPQLPAKLSPGLPVDLLRRRPDLRQAERELAMNTALVGVRTAELFPSLSLTGGLGLQGEGALNNSFIWSAGPAAYWPLLDFGTLDSLVEAQKSQTQAALLNYKEAILKAVEEVNNAIDSYATEQKRMESLAEAQTASKEAVRLAEERYKRGLTDFLNVTDAERQLYAIEDQYAISREAATLQYIALYKSLGGGWQEYQKVPAPPAPRPAVMAELQSLTGKN